MVRIIDKKKVVKKSSTVNKRVAGKKAKLKKFNVRTEGEKKIPKVNNKNDDKIKSKSNIKSSIKSDIKSEIRPDIKFKVRSNAKSKIKSKATSMLKYKGLKKESNHSDKRIDRSDSLSKRIAFSKFRKDYGFLGLKINNINFSRFTKKHFIIFWGIFFIALIAIFYGFYSFDFGDTGSFVVSSESKLNSNVGNSECYDISDPMAKESCYDALAKAKGKKYYCYYLSDLAKMERCMKSIN